MADLSTVRLQGWVERLRAGDAAAADELIGHVSERLRRLARHMLHGGYARVRDVQETDDVLQSALLRLHRALQDPAVRIASVPDFLRLAAVQIRRELIDLTRRHFGPARPRLVSPADVAGSSGDTPPLHEPADSAHGPDRLLAWREFHERVAKLPAEEREVFDLLWYQELTQAEAAALLGVSVPTVKRRWLSARLSLQQALQGSGLDW
jgi:RNA polymerase sigma-70 factor (ECF subfamily)